MCSVLFYCSKVASVSELTHSPFQLAGLLTPQVPDAEFAEFLAVAFGVGVAGPELPAAGGEGLPDLADFTDDQVKALTQIQAAGRGMLDRKKVKGMRGTKEDGVPEGGIVLRPPREPVTLTLPQGLRNRNEVITAVFTALDRDDSGFIERDELKAAFGAMVSKLGGGGGLLIVVR